MSWESKLRHHLIVTSSSSCFSREMHQIWLSRSRGLSWRKRSVIMVCLTTFWTCGISWMFVSEPGLSSLPALYAAKNSYLPKASMSDLSLKVVIWVTSGTARVRYTSWLKLRSASLAILLRCRLTVSLSSLRSWSNSEMTSWYRLSSSARSNERPRTWSLCRSCGEVFAISTSARLKRTSWRPSLRKMCAEKCLRRSSGDKLQLTRLEVLYLLSVCHHLKGSYMEDGSWESQTRQLLIHRVSHSYYSTMMTSWTYFELVIGQ